METTMEFGVGDECIILDKHTISSIYLGEDQLGYARFNTTYTDLGILIYKLKYKSDVSVIPEIINLIKNQLDRYLNMVNLIVPVPPSDKKRQFQPVFELVKAVAEYLEKDYKLDILFKLSDEKAKDKKSVANTIKKNYNFDNKVNILLIDDIYSTGMTMRECCRVLKEDKNVNNVYCLAMTKTK